ncbi:unnamed protein product [Soboliphyme baturini]|uniref:CRAL-TRIO domain-containing protein n=1 Tax=Soboliphyme baturini TaxID=241478 RepID=A0A183I9C1_9BILA|nr:unnamed protein product [Soboliphyme baturini]
MRLELVKKLQSFAMCQPELRISLIDGESQRKMFHYEPTSDLVSAYSQLFKPHLGCGFVPVFINSVVVESKFNLWTNESEDLRGNRVEVVSVNGIPIDHCKVHEMVCDELIKFIALKCSDYVVSASKPNFYLSVECPESSINWLRPGVLRPYAVRSLVNLVEALFCVAIDRPAIKTVSLKNLSRVTLGSKFASNPLKFVMSRPAASLPLPEAVAESAPSYTETQPANKECMTIAAPLSIEKLYVYRGCSATTTRIAFESDHLKEYDVGVSSSNDQAPQRLKMDRTMLQSVKEC